MNTSQKKKIPSYRKPKMKKVARVTSPISKKKHQTKKMASGFGN